jgi:ATP-binding cassette subfamily B protein
MFIISMSTVAVLLIGGYDHEKIGDISAFIIYLSQIAGALQMLTGLINMLPRAEASSARILELLEADTELPKELESITDVEITGTIEFDHVTFAYNNSSPILKDITFKINSGEKLGIIGPTGSGKTSLVNLISRFYDVTEGQVKVDDIDVRKYDLHTLRSQISTVMQKALLFAGTIEDNVRLGAMSAEEQLLISSSKDAEAYEFITRFTDGYNSILGERGINLSGGQKQRLSMARSFITEPRILIFDDSTSAVDMTTEVKILDAINKHINNKTVIIIAQRIRSVMNADKIIVIENGVITGHGSHEELLKNNKYYQDIYETQIGGVNNGK